MTETSPDKENPVFGIDLGTTNSCIARYTSDGPVLIPIDGFALVPSVVAHDGNGLLVGRRARNHSRIDPSQAAVSIKRRMGEPQYRVELADMKYSPIEISSKILSYLREQAEREIGAPVKRAVVTVPAWFGDAERRATLEAGEQAGLEVIRIVNEPTAASLVYADTTNADGSQTWVVYDLGGGTFDVSVLRVLSPVAEVLASCGNTFLGGDDFDNELANLFIRHLKDRYQKDFEADPVFRARLRQIAEDAKIVLSTAPQVHVRDVIVRGNDSFEIDLSLSRETFESLIEDYIDSTVEKVRQALEDAHVKIEEVDRLLLVGGSTRIPLVARELENLFGRTPEGYVDPDYAVALGAALQAGITAGFEYKNYVVDICPHSLGVAALGDLDEEDMAESFLKFLTKGKKAKEKKRNYPLTFVPIIKRNSKLPAKFTEEFYKMFPEQEGVQIRVFQGESRRTTENTFIGSFHAPLPKNSDYAIFLGFEYDENGIIQISVSDPTSQRVCRRFTMNLSKSAKENTDKKEWTLENWEEEEEDDFVEEERAVEADKKLASTATNFLISRIEKEIGRRQDEDTSNVVDMLSRYRELLSENKDNELDGLEDELYAWLERKGEAADA